MKIANSQKDPRERDVAALANDPDQKERDREIRERDDRVRSDLRKQNLRLPQIAHAVRHEV
jgi:hypothetical protein